MIEQKWASFSMGPDDGKTAGDFWSFLQENKWDGTHPNDLISLAKENDPTVLWPIVTEKINAKANHNIAWIPFKTTETHNW